MLEAWPGLAWLEQDEQAGGGPASKSRGGRVSFCVNAGPSEGFEPRSESRESSGGVRSSWTPDVFDGRTNRIS